ncbi:MAG: hypothetical protein WBH71_05395 [Bacteroidales bacterium]|jgi:hypothetical protein|nr:hypothetical protein [Bacteroidales bacterium]MDI9593456.1 hypothetical protein [Bacteroidota bacterium]HOF17039.1 hypothetical protein [Bacteroidales bacterium]
MEKDNHLLERIRQYKVDFAYSAYTLFNAYKRHRNNERKRRKLYVILNLISIACSIATISLLMIFLSQSIGQHATLYVATILSFLSIMIGFYLIFNKNYEKSFKYLLRAEKINILFKQTKNVETFIKAGVLSDKEIAENIQRLQTKFENITIEEPLPVETIDYQTAKKQLQEGEKSYNDNEIYNL